MKITCERCNWSSEASELFQDDARVEQGVCPKCWRVIYAANEPTAEELQAMPPRELAPNWLKNHWARGGTNRSK
jgi:hypothetical protein